MSNKSFIELYNESKNKPTPAQEFVSEVARITHRSEATVRMWLSGKQIPDALVLSVIADHFNVDMAGLFPEKGGDK
jgi:transcriptional regulator with XRE-family HTH domain